MLEIIIKAIVLIVVALVLVGIALASVFGWAVRKNRDDAGC